MNGASKILTVSYGTFSCTLEGFDEPFNTMKAIAEYFRDLAADDRYFGAEPPTPDAAMLHKIAEREIQRRVEAKIGDNGVHLRAQEPAVAELAAPAVPEPSVLPTLTAIPEGVAARLAKIRASVAKGDAEIAPMAAAFVEPEFTEDQHADEFAEELADLAIFDDAEIAPVDVPAEAPVAVTVAEAVVKDLPDFDATRLDDDMAHDMLADLAALDAPMVSQDLPVAALSAQVVAEDAGFDMADLDLGMDEPEITETPVDAPVAAAQDDDLSARLGALIDPDDIEEDLATVTAPTWDDAVEDDMLAELDASEAALIAPEADIAADEDGVEAMAVIAPDAELAAEEEVVDSAALIEPDADIAAEEDVIAAIAEDVATTDIPAPHDTAAEPALQAEAPAAETVADAAPEVSDKIQRARARVIRIRRSPDMAAVTVAPEPVALAEPAPTLTPTLTDEAEAELARELAALEGADTPADVESVADDSIADDDAELRRQLAMIEDDANAVAVEPAAEPVQDTASHAAIADAVQDAAVSRLMQQTQSEMAVPENRRRLSAIAHLKAAVAATVAERFGSKAKTEDVEATRAEPYRDDLARVVRPRRPEGSGAAPARPAPLVLVSEQRIDRPAPPAAAPGPVIPVRPRRVSAAALAPQLVEEFDDDEDEDDENIFTDAKGFAEFADRLGAHSLSDMLEAAAAYAATVEGRPSFSRPQLMRQVSIATGETDVSREDGLRSFGTLLRDGRIIKVRRGQFALTDQSRFLADAKKITD